MTLYADTLDFFCNRIPRQHAAILELACGPGNITWYLLDKRPDFKILGTDLSPNMLELAKRNNPSAQFRLMDCRDTGLPDNHYEGIMCGFCLPYLSREETTILICNASRILKPGGLLYLSTMEDDYEKSGFRKGSTGDEIYMHYYRKTDLIPLLKEHQFKLLMVTRKQYPAPDGSTTTDLIMIAEKIADDPL